MKRPATPVPLLLILFLLAVAVTSCRRDASFHAALTRAEALMESDPRAALAQYYLGCTYSDMGRDLDAIDAFLRAITLFPDTTNKYYAYSFFELGQQYLTHEKVKEALVAFQHYRCSDACQSDSLNIGYGDRYLGMSYLYMNKAEQAEPYFLKVIDNPFVSKMYKDNTNFQLAKLYAYLNEDYAKAKPYVEKSIAGYKDKESIGAAYHVKADILWHEGELDSAFYYYKKVLTCKLEKPRVFDPRGRSCADPRKRFYFDPQRALAGGVIFISPYLPALAALILRTLSPVSSI